MRLNYLVRSAVVVKRRSMKIAPLLFLVTMSAGGCAFGDRHVSLLYEPVDDTYAVQERVAVVTFVDERPRDRLQDVGEVRNGYGMVTANVRIDTKKQQLENQDIGQWVANALVEELRRAGADVQCFDSAQAAAGYPVIVSGSVSQLWVNMYMQYDAKIRTNVRITRNGEVVFEGPIKGDYETMAWFGSRSDYEKALRKTLQAWIRNTMPHLVGPSPAGV